MRSSRSRPSLPAEAVLRLTRRWCGFAPIRTAGRWFTPSLSDHCSAAVVTAPVTARVVAPTSRGRGPASLCSAQPVCGNFAPSFRGSEDPEVHRKRNARAPDPRQLAQRRKCGRAAVAVRLLRGSDWTHLVGCAALFGSARQLRKFIRKTVKQVPARPLLRKRQSLTPLPPGFAWLGAKWLVAIHLPCRIVDVLASLQLLGDRHAFLSFLPPLTLRPDHTQRFRQWTGIGGAVPWPAPPDTGSPASGDLSHSNVRIA